MPEHNATPDSILKFHSSLSRDDKILLIDIAIRMIIEARQNIQAILEQLLPCLSVLKNAMHLRFRLSRSMSGITESWITGVLFSCTSPMKS